MKSVAVVGQGQLPFDRKLSGPVSAILSCLVSGARCSTGCWEMCQGPTSEWTDNVIMTKIATNDQISADQVISF